MADSSYQAFLEYGDQNPSRTLASVHDFLLPPNMNESPQLW